MLKFALGFITSPILLIIYANKRKSREEMELYLELNNPRGNSVYDFQRYLAGKRRS
jgi:hypothetical protein